MKNTMTDRAALSGKIAVLPPDLINQIAAGEVIERPASVVKELVENSIDAGSHRIEVEVKSGGRLLIRVQDDGEGMGREDALLAFERHATSKIKTDRDLLSIQTLGFRGEALPSIAAVSKIRMVTCPRGGEDPASGSAGPPQVNVATEVSLEGGRLLGVQEAGSPAGTLIEVRELFFNTPARLKFLKSVATELGHISHLLQQQALAHPHISFRLLHESRPLLDLPAVSDGRSRIQQVYGQTLTEHLVGVETEWAGLKVWGMVSSPPHTKSTRAYQEIFVNQRVISSPFILHAVYEAYETALMKGQHPVVLLFLEMDGQMLDVNVHPAKREVRFRDQRLIYDLVKECVRAGLQCKSQFEADRIDRVKEATAIYLKTQDMRSSPQRWTPQTDPGTASPGGVEKESVLEAVVPATGQITELPELGTEVWPLGQVYDTYLLARIQGELWIVDQHAAHERVLYEKLLKDVAEERLPIQRLLIPQTLELSKAQVMILQKVVEQLESLGIEMESFGSGSLVVRAVPIFLTRVDLQSLVMDLIDDLTHFEKSSSAEDHWKRLAATLACHGAVKANEILTQAEMAALLKDLLQLPAAAMTCPHGRPLKVKFTRKALETMFKR